MFFPKGIHTGSSPEREQISIIMYEYHNNILSIPAKLLYEDWALMAYKTYLTWCTRGKLVRTKHGRGASNEAFVSYKNLPPNIKEICLKELGDPRKVAVKNILLDYMVPDQNAVAFFARHRKPDGNPLAFEKQVERATNVMILNAIRTILNDYGVASKAFGRKKTHIWKNISDAVNNINTKDYSHSLPGNDRSLRRRYDRYNNESYMCYIHANEGNDHKLKLKDEVADFILATYCLPVKYTTPEVLEKYEQIMEANKWPSITEGAISNFLDQPENKRIWMLARHGKEDWAKEFKHTLTRDKSNWFPNSYWAIDGTKLDWVHFWDDASNKMGAKLKIDVVFDVFSEKIIGWSLSFTENHVDHFKAIKMAVNEAACRPYLFTYDNQSGHKMNRMQDLYSSLVAKSDDNGQNGGTHYPHKAGEHNSPAEPIFRRLQQQVINKFWFSDGQSIKVRRADNRMNEDFVYDNKDILKTVEELYQAWETAVNLWNDKKHPQFKKQTRSQVYNQEMPQQQSLSLFDIMDKMWIEEKERPITYKGHGIDVRIADKKYQYEVLDADGNIDLEFRRKYVGQKFIIRYDPDYLDGYIQLCLKDEQNNVVNIANAQPKRKHQAIPVLMKDGDKEKWQKDLKIRDIELARDEADYQALVKRTGISREKLIDDQELLVKFKGRIPKDQRSTVEANENLTASRF